MGEKALSEKEIAKRLGINVNKVANDWRTVRAKLGSLIRDEILLGCSTPEEFTEELAFFRELFGR